MDTPLEDTFNVEQFVEDETELALKNNPEVLATLMRYYDGIITAAELGEVLAALVDKTEDDIRLFMKEHHNSLKESENN
jgi:hypothetical protein